MKFHKNLKNIEFKESVNHSSDDEYLSDNYKSLNKSQRKRRGQEISSFKPKLTKNWSEAQLICLTKQICLQKKEMNEIREKKKIDSDWQELQNIKLFKLLKILMTHINAFPHVNFKNQQTIFKDIQKNLKSKKK